MDTEDETEPREVPPLFAFLMLLAVALARGKVTKQQAAIGIFVAISTRGTTGEHGTVDVERLQLELDLSERQVWRHFGLFRDAGWLTQTVKPTRGYNGRPGRRARFRLSFPSLNLADDSSQIRLPEVSGATSDETATELESPGVFGSNRLAFSEESSAIAEREVGRVTPSYGSPTDGNPSELVLGASTTGQARDELAALTPDTAAERDVDFAARGAAAVRAELGKVAGQ